jgi:hypothetical protein
MQFGGNRLRNIVAMLMATCVTGGCHAPLGRAIGRTAGQVATPLAGLAPASSGASALGIAGRPTVSLEAAGVQLRPGVWLTGKVKAPASIVSDNGGLVISDNGGGIVSNNGSGFGGNGGHKSAVGVGFHLAAAGLTEQPVVNRPVYLLDAAGRVVVDASGKPLTGLTNANGEFRLAGVSTGHALVIAADLGAKGIEQGIVTAAATGPTDLNLISTLTTSYIIDRYVLPVADPVKTLDRLPVDVEAATRGIAAQAFASSVASVPASLEPALIDGTLDALRKQNGVLDGQLETVRRILLAAGQADFGNGSLGTTVTLNKVTAIAAAPAGRVVFADESVKTSRVWLLKSDGTLQAIVGTGTTGGPPDAARNAGDSAPTTSISLGQVGTLAFDGAERLIVLDDQRRVLRVEPNGQTLVAASAGAGVTFLALSMVGNDEIAVLEESSGSLAVETVSPGAAPHRIALTSTPEQFRGQVFSGMAGQFLVTPPGGGPIVKIDPRTGLVGPTSQTGRPDAAGNVWRNSAAAWLVHMVTGSDLTITPPSGFVADYNTLTLGSDGIAWVVQAGRRLFRLERGAATLVAGLAASNESAGGVKTALDHPIRTVASADGTLYVLEGPRPPWSTAKGSGGGAQFGARGRVSAVLRVAPDLTATTVVSNLGHVTRLARDASDDLFVLAWDDPLGVPNLSKITAKTPGIVTALPSPPQAAAAGGVGDLAVLPDGTVYVCQGDVLYKLVGDRYQVIDAGNLAVKYLSVDPKGRLWAFGPDHSAASGTIGVARSGDDGKLMAVASTMRELTGSIAVDREGRIYVGKQDTVIRYPVATESPEIVAGKGGRLLNGSTADDGVSDAVDLAIDTNGDLLITDDVDRQVKRVPASKL